jgi:hypothetical protein
MNDSIGVLYPLLFLFVTAIILSLYNRSKKYPKTPKYGPPIPSTAGCTKQKYHSWDRGGWNGAIYHSGAVGRSGYRCYHCGTFVWDKTDAEFVNALPQWMLESPDCTIAERFLQYIPKEVLDKRQENIDTSVIENLQRQIKAAQEKEIACKAELAELE